MKNILEISIFAIKAIFFVIGLHQLTDKKKSIKNDSILWLLLFLWGYLFQVNGLRPYMLKVMLEIILIIAYIKIECISIDNLSAISYICLLEVMYEITNFICAIFVSISGWFLYIEQKDLVVLICLALMSLFFYIVIRNRRLYKEYLLMSARFKYGVIFTYVIFLCIKISIVFTDIQDARALKSAIIAMVISLAIFTVISGREKHQTAAEKVKMEEDNRRLSAQLHKSKEIFPAMLLALKQMADKEAGIDSGQAHQLLMEVHDLYGHQLNENHQEDLLLKTFGSTGFQTLDMQLQGYIQEAAEKGINMDIFIPGPIDELIKAEKINQLRFQRAIGDMVRNAFHAIEKTGNSEGEIFVIIGCGEKDILEIVVMDNGVDFPKEVLDNFGKRGVTLDGTGNGLADLAEFAKAEKASLVLEQYTEDEEFFSKQLSVLFDGKSSVEIKA